MMEAGVPYKVRGWGRLSGPGYLFGIINLRRAYLLAEEFDPHSLLVVDAVTGWSGRLTHPLSAEAL